MSTQAELFGQRLQQARKARGWSLRELARQAGVGGSKVIAGYERGENEPGVFRAARLAALLGVSLETLLAPGSDGEVAA